MVGPYSTWLSAGTSVRPGDGDSAGSGAGGQLRDDRAARPHPVGRGVAEPAALATMVCVWAPPSDQLTNSYAVPPIACGEGALTESVEPTIAVLVKGVGWLVDPTASVSPAGLDPNVRSTVCGSSWTLVGVRQAAGIGRGEPQLQVRRVLVVGGDEAAARRTRVGLERMLVAGRRAVLQHERPREGGCRQRPLLRRRWRDPRSVIVSPTFQVVPAAGVSITAVGGVLPAEIGDRRRGARPRRVGDRSVRYRCPAGCR